MLLGLLMLRLLHRPFTMKKSIGMCHEHQQVDERIDADACYFLPK